MGPGTPIPTARISSPWARSRASRAMRLITAAGPKSASVGCFTFFTTLPVSSTSPYLQSVPPRSIPSSKRAIFRLPK